MGSRQLEPELMRPAMMGDSKGDDLCCEGMFLWNRRKVISN